MKEKIIEKIGQVARGEIAVEELPGSTTERITIGLALNALEKTNPSFEGDEEGAWWRLDRWQCDTSGHSIPHIARRNGRSWRG